MSGAPDGYVPGPCTGITLVRTLWRVSTRPADRWASGSAYDRFIGRWSRLVAVEFLAWLAVPAGRDWLDVGCGTGALTEAILARMEPRSVVGVDPSPGFLEQARENVADPRARFRVGSAAETGVSDASADVVVAGLVLNFVPDALAALREAHRVVRPGGTVAGYVWDYAGRMEILRLFWDVVAELDPDAAALNEGSRFPIAGRQPLGDAVLAAGFEGVEVRAIDIRAHFPTFEDYWTPFLGGTGPAGTYAVSLDAPRQAALREQLRVSLPTASDDSIRMAVRAWAVKGRRPA